MACYRRMANLVFGVVLLIVLATPLHAQFEGIVDRVKPSVVLVAVTRAGIQGVGAGSGYFADGGGYIVTARHVIEGTNRIVVRTQDGKELNAILVRYSPEFDGAILKVEGTGFSPLSFGDSDTIRQGNEVLVFGYPLATTMGTSTFTVTRGIISAIRPGNEGVQIDAALNPGNSGGPVVNLRGEVIGIAVSGYWRAQGLNLAVPSNLLRSMMADLTPTAITPPNAHPSVYPLSGTWFGVWQSTSLFSLSRTGVFTGDFVQEGESVKGSAKMTGSAFTAPNVDVKGTFDGVNFKVETFVGRNRTATLTGKLVGPDEIQGRYSASLDAGTIVLKKTRGYGN